MRTASIAKSPYRKVLLWQSAVVVYFRTIGEERTLAALKMLNDATDAVPRAERGLTTSYMSCVYIRYQDMEKTDEER